MGTAAPTGQSSAHHRQDMTLSLVIVNVVGTLLLDSRAIHIIQYESLSWSWMAWEHSHQLRTSVTNILPGFSFMVQVVLQIVAHPLCIALRGCATICIVPLSENRSCYYFPPKPVYGQNHVPLSVMCHYYLCATICITVMLQIRLIYLKGPLGIWREEKMDEKFWRGAQVYRQNSLLEIGRRVKCKISFWRKKKWENDCILMFSRNFHSQRWFLHSPKTNYACPDWGVSSRQIPKGPFR
jgi:hypothetical protein